MQQEEQLRDQLDQARVAAALQIPAVMTPTRLAQAASKHQQEHQIMHDTSAP